MVESIKEVLMRRDGDSEETANERIKSAKDELDELISLGDTMTAFDICQLHFGLEPDYIMDLM